MSHIFISYSRVDRAAALQFVSGLSSLGFSVWIDEQIRSGERFDQEIERRLREAGCVLVLWSQESVASSWVRAEAREALEHRKLISVRIEAGAKLPLEFAYIQTIDCIEWDNLQVIPEFAAVLRDVRTLLEAAGSFRNDADQRPMATGTVLESSSRKAMPSESAYKVPADLEQRLRERIQQEIISAVELRPLPKLCQDVEDAILDYLSVVLLEEFTRLAAASGLECRQLGRSRVACSGSRLELRVTPSEQDPIIVIAFVAIALDARRARTTLLKADIHGSGRFREMHLVVDSSLEPWQCALGKIATRILEAGARWLEQHVKSELNKLTGNVASELYRIIREILPEKLAAEVWLFAITKEKGIYLSDPIQREHARHRFLARRIVASPIGQLAELTTNVLKSTDLFAGEILGQDGTLEVDISRAQYDTDFELAEEAVYHTSRLAGQPLVKEGGSRLIAGYPSHLRPEIEVVLARERRRFRDTLAESTRSLRRLVRDLEPTVVVPGLEAQLGNSSEGMIKQLRLYHRSN